MITDYSDKDLNRAEEVREEIIGPRCAECGGVGPMAPKWAGEQYGWCECPVQEPECGCTVVTSLGGGTIHPALIHFCPLHLAAPETARQRDALLEAAKITVALVCPDKKHFKPTTQTGQTIHDAVCSTTELREAIQQAQAADTGATEVPG